MAKRNYFTKQINNKNKSKNNFYKESDYEK